MPETEEEKKAREAREAADKQKAEAEALARTGSGAGGGGTPFAVFPDAESFNKRVAQATRAALKEAGITETDPAKLKLIVDEHAKQAQTAAEAERARMSEVDRLKADNAKLEAEKAAAMSSAEEEKMRAHVLRVCAQKGITNPDYAFFAIASKLNGMKDTEELDESVFLDELMKDDKHKAALGMAGPVITVQGANTTQPGGGGTPPGVTPAGGGGTQAGGGGEDLMALKRDDFNANLQKRFGWQP